MHKLTIKRAYEAYAADDGKRVLVDRLWPRGIKKEDAHIDQWLKEIAPTDELRKWFHQKPEHFAEFEKRYRKELEEKAETRQAVEELLELLRKNTVTLIYSAKDEEHNNAKVLQSVLQKKRGRN